MAFAASVAAIGRLDR
jgi:hypothetical protein